MPAIEPDAYLAGIMAKQQDEERARLTALITPPPPSVHPLESNDTRMIDMHSCEQVEVVTDGGRRLWVNVNGVCIFRVQIAQEIIMQVGDTNKYHKQPE